MSGVKVRDEVRTTFDQMKRRKICSYMLLSMTNKDTEVGVAKCGTAGKIFPFLTPYLTVFKVRVQLVDEVKMDEFWCILKLKTSSSL